MFWRNVILLEVIIEVSFVERRDEFGSYPIRSVPRQKSENAQFDLLPLSHENVIKCQCMGEKSRHMDTFQMKENKTLCEWCGATLTVKILKNLNHL